MKKGTALFFYILSLLVILLSVSAFDRADIGATDATAAFRTNTGAFVQSVIELNNAVKAMNHDSLSIAKAKAALLNCRLHFKSIACFAAYFFPSETKVYNAPPKYEVEEPELELEEPMGLQQIEALLFDHHPLADKAALLVQIDAMYTSAKDLTSLLYNFKANDRQVLESLRLELIRIATLYISGYDAPLLKSGIQESLQASLTLHETLQPYLDIKNPESKILAQTLDRSVAYLSVHPDFDSFDRLAYLTQFNLPLQQQLGALIKRLHLELNTTAYLNYNTDNIFSAGFLNHWDSIPERQRSSLAALGKRLFFDPALSGNLHVSCNTCHQPEKYFTDGQFRSPSLLHHSVLKRNTPTLLYAGYQHMQFWDGRAPDMVTQIKTVLYNPLEMGGSFKSLQKNIYKNPRYRLTLNSLMRNDMVAKSEVDVIASALAVYVGSLAPLNSPFDRYLRGEKTSMTVNQIKGFNLFMGKAQCGTCHFAPYFNSLTPPLFDVSETEILGTPRTGQLDKPETDPDAGRYDLYQIRYYRQAFKTPTLRNIQKTAPYMHNGAFKTLESVLAFYNKGGGNGIGLKNEDQTLPSAPLHLSAQETNQIIQFMNALTDEQPVSLSALKTIKQAHY